MDIAVKEFLFAIRIGDLEAAKNILRAVLILRREIAIANLSQGIIPGAREWSIRTRYNLAE